MRKKFDINHYRLIEGVIVTLRSYKDKVPDIIMRVASNTDGPLNPTAKLKKFVIYDGIVILWEHEVYSNIGIGKIWDAVRFLSETYPRFREKGFVFPTPPDRLVNSIVKGRTFEEKKKIFFDSISEVNLEMTVRNLNKKTAEINSKLH